MKLVRGVALALLAVGGIAAAVLWSRRERADAFEAHWAAAMAGLRASDGGIRLIAAREAAALAGEVAVRHRPGRWGRGPREADLAAVARVAFDRAEDPAVRAAAARAYLTLVAPPPIASDWRPVALAVAALALPVVALVAYIRIDSRRFLGRVEPGRGPGPPDPPVRGRDLRIFVRPRRVHFRRRDDLPWADPAAVAGRVESLRALGFRDLGPHEFAGLATSRLWALAEPEGMVVATVSEHHDWGLSISLYTRYRDGGSFTVSNLTGAPRFDQPPEYQLVHLDLPDAPALHHRFLELRPDRPMRSIATAAEFIASYEQFHADLVDWRNARGGMTAEELRALNRAMEPGPTDREIADVLRQLGARALEELDISLGERHLDRAGLRGEERERASERLVVVHDRHAAEQLAHWWFADLLEADARAARAASAAARDARIAGGATLYDEWIDAEPRRKALAWRTLAPRPAFAALNARLAEPARFLKVGELDWPLATDVYLAPDGPREEP